MSNPYTQQSISGFNSSPPPNDGSTGSSNEADWTAQVIGKVGTPLKNLAEAIDAAIYVAFGKRFLNTVSGQTTTYNLLAADEGKLFNFTGAGGITLNLLDVATATAGFAIAVYNGTSSTVTLDGDSAEEVNGATTLVLFSGDSAIVTCTGSAWVAQVIRADPFTTGDVKLTLKASADAGWVLMDDGTIGDASSSGSTRANADTEDLFTLLWTNVADQYCPVSSGRGASAAADFAAHKTIRLPRTVGRALANAGQALLTSTFTVDTGADELTVDSNDTMLTGQACTVSSSTTLPSPLAGATTYYIIRSSATVIQLATTLSNALAGTAIDLTDTGSGTHTITLTFTDRALGETSGTDDHVLLDSEKSDYTVANTVATLNKSTDSVDSGGGGGSVTVLIPDTSINTHTHSLTASTDQVGHSNMSPTVFLNVMIKL